MTFRFAQGGNQNYFCFKIEKAFDREERKVREDIKQRLSL